ncbi:MAG: DinB family protein [Chloroflexi bacterium]|nr:DinB family protein [Chloroflexota bacterium]
MLDFTALGKGIKMRQLTENLTPNDLRALTNEMLDTMQNLIANCADEDVTFVPKDANAYDSFADDPDLVHLAWTLGHVIAHVTASAEESAFIAAELARGVPHRGGRSRYEIPWDTITTIAQCRERLEESRRMRLALLDAWPPKPDLQNAYESRPGFEPLNAITRFVFGLKHDNDHLNQLADIVRQAQAARRP